MKICNQNASKLSEYKNIVIFDLDKGDPVVCKSPEDLETLCPQKDHKWTWYPRVQLL